MWRILIGLPSPTLTLPRDMVTLPKASPDSLGHRYHWSHQTHRLPTPAPQAQVRWVWGGAWASSGSHRLAVLGMLTNSTFRSIPVRWFWSWGQPRVLERGGPGLVAQKCQGVPPHRREVSPRRDVTRGSPGQVGAWHPHKVMHSRTVSGRRTRA